MDEEAKTAQARTFAEGLEFLDVNHPADNWFLQIEEFDPHEPFFCDEKYKKDFDGPLHGEDALGSDWPPYARVQEGEDAEAVKKMKARIREYMIATDAPKELYHRYGIEQ